MGSREPSRTRGRAARAGGCLLGAALGLWSGAANALPAIGWEAPAGCPAAPRVEARIREVVGARPVSEAVVAVRARVRRQGEGWLLAVVFTRRDGTTERRLTLHDCEATADATALLVGIALVGAPGDAGSEIPLAVPVPEAAERETGQGHGGESGEKGRKRAEGRGEDGEQGRERAAADSAGPEQGRVRAAAGAGRRYDAGTERGTFFSNASGFQNMKPRTIRGTPAKAATSGTAVPVHASTATVASPSPSSTATTWHAP